MPPYCEAGHSGEFGHGTQTAGGSLYCLFRQVGDGYVTPPEGWSPYTGTFTIVTALFPSSPWGDFVPGLAANYPHVLLTYHRGNPNGYPNWSAMYTAFGQVPNGEEPPTAFAATGNSIDLVRVFDCEPTDFTCEYEIRPGDGSPGDPPEWYRVRIAEDVDPNNGGLDLSSFAGVAAGIGLVADGNQPPLVNLVLTGSSGPDLQFLADANVTDPDDDAIAGYVFDWGDGQQTETAMPQADHTYTSGGTFVVTAYAQDARGAVGFAHQNAGSLFAPDVTGPSAVAVGEQIVVDVTLTNVGMVEQKLAHNYGYAGAPPPSTVTLASNPSFAATPVPRGGSLMGTYVFDTLRDGTVRFKFGGSVTVTGCPSCTASRFVEHQVVIGSGVSATSTATPAAGAPTPSPTATPPLDGLDDPAAAKRAVKCQQALAKAHAKATAARAKLLAACGGKIARCVQTKPGDQACLDKAAAACGRAKPKLLAADRKMMRAIDKACGPLDAADLVADAGIGAGAATAACLDHGSGAVTDLPSLLQCLLELTACTGADVVESTLPRLAELLALVGADLNDSPCLDTLGGGGDVGDRKLGKVVDKCGAAIAKAGQKLVGAQTKGLDRCAAAVMTCAQQKPGDERCLTRATATCAKVVAARTPAAQRLRDDIVKKCGALDFATLAATAGLDLAGLAPGCAAVGIAALDDLDDYAVCLERLVTCATDHALAVAVPRIAELLEASGQSFREPYCD